MLNFKNVTAVVATIFAFTGCEFSFNPNQCWQGDPCAMDVSADGTSHDVLVKDVAADSSDNTADSDAVAKVDLSEETYDSTETAETPSDTKDGASPDVPHLPECSNTECNDGDPCTVDQCDNGKCKSFPSKSLVGLSCDDKNACTKLDQCDDVGTCKGTDLVVCTTADECHDTGVCDTATGACSNPSKKDGTNCSDGNACTTNDVCTGGACAGAQVTCNDNDKCTADTCDATEGCIFTPVDTDNDTVCDAVDNCPSVSNKNQLNTDGDAQGDACDDDDDNDTVLDASDNCALVANTNQQNSDADAQGDACDDDDDGDGIKDDGDGSGVIGDKPCTGGVTTACDDNCPLDSNADQADIDHDGLGDICDNIKNCRDDGASPPGFSDPFGCVKFCVPMDGKGAIVAIIPLKPNEGVGACWTGGTPDYDGVGAVQGDCETADENKPGYTHPDPFFCWADGKPPPEISISGWVVTAPPP